MIIALTGSPNCGKTALFNALTGSRQKVANYAGVTVEKKEGQFTTPHGTNYKILDLPGTYSLSPKTPDEKVTSDVLFNRFAGETSPDVLVAVADATAIGRHLPLILEIQALGKPMILALNMMDLAEGQGIQIDLGKLSQELGIPVVPTVAVKAHGIDSLIRELESISKSSKTIETQKAAPLRDRFTRADEIMELTVKQDHSPLIRTHALDKFLLHPISGYAILALLLFLVFQALFSWAAPFQDGIESGIATAAGWITQTMPDGSLKSLILDGLFAGVGSVLVFLPQILILFGFIILLEDSGYMARAAFLMDRSMSQVGLHGRAFIPLLSSYACAIPGIMATRTIENPRDRITTILIAPLTTCSARLPVYTLLIGAFIPDLTVWGFNLKGVVLFSLYAFGLLAALSVAWVLKRMAFKGPVPPLFLELPSYKRPSMKNLALGLLERSKIFLRRAGTVILSLSLILWFLSSYPKVENPTSGMPAIYDTYAGKIGRAIEPVLLPIGFNWRIAIGLVPGFAAREVMVSALSTVYSIEQKQTEEENEAALGKILKKEWPLATALSLLVWYVFAPQCISTIAVTRRETQSWKWPLIQFGYMLTLAYGVSWLVFKWAVSMGWGTVS